MKIWYIASKKTGKPISIDALASDAIGFRTKKALMEALNNELYPEEEIRSSRIIEYIDNEIDSTHGEGITDGENNERL